LKIDEKQFNQFLLELDPQITTYESYEIFKAADLSQDGFVNLN
jgi:Ca2+-binding EF-hand superfamily protein